MDFWTAIDFCCFNRAAYFCCFLPIWCNKCGHNYALWVFKDVLKSFQFCKDQGTAKIFSIFFFNTNTLVSPVNYYHCILWGNLPTPITDLNEGRPQCCFVVCENNQFQIGGISDSTGFKWIIWKGNLPRLIKEQLYRHCEIQTNSSSHWQHRNIILFTNGSKGIMSLCYNYWSDNPHGCCFTIYFLVYYV